MGYKQSQWKYETDESNNNLNEIYFLYHISGKGKPTLTGNFLAWKCLY